MWHNTYVYFNNWKTLQFFFRIVFQWVLKTFEPSNSIPKYILTQWVHHLLPPDRSGSLNKTTLFVTSGLAVRLSAGWRRCQLSSYPAPPPSCRSSCFHRCPRAVSPLLTAAACPHFQWSSDNDKHSRCLFLFQHLQIRGLWTSIRLSSRAHRAHRG